MKNILSYKGYTIIEFIIVIAILGIISLIAIPKYLGFADKAKEANDRELGTVIAGSLQKHIASEDIKTDGIHFATVTVSDAGHRAPLSYSSINLEDKNGYSITDTDLTPMLQEIIGSSSHMQKASRIIITIDANGDISTDSDISYI